MCLHSEALNECGIVFSYARTEESADAAAAECEAIINVNWRFCVPTFHRNATI